MISRSGTSVRWPANTTTIYAYEDGALRSVQRAERQGLGRIWDLPLPHYRTIETILRDEAKRWLDKLAWIPTEEEFTNNAGYRCFRFL